MKEAVFLGNVRQVLRDFPETARREAGYEIDRVQNGIAPRHWKPMNAIGAGVKEIRIREDNGAYRVIYTANLPDAVYILHAFQKKIAENGRDRH